MVAEDIIDALLRELRQLSPQMTPDEAWRIETRLRHACGGVLGYVRKSATTDAKTWRLGLGLAAGRPLSEAFADIGVSRATGFRLLRRRCAR